MRLRPLRQSPTLAALRRAPGFLVALLHPRNIPTAVGAIRMTLRVLRESARRVWAMGRAVAENPIVTKELGEIFQTRRAVILFALFLGLLGLTIYAAWPRGDLLLSNIDVVARRLVTVVGTTLLALICLLAPAFSAVAITGEKERRCFESLVTSGLSSKGILLGKLIASLVFLVMLIITATPMLSLCLLLGGVSPGELLGMFLLLLEAALGFTVLGLTASCIFERNNAAIGASYIIALPLMAVLLTMAWQGGLFSPGISMELLLVSVVITFFILSIFSRTTVRPRESRPSEEETAWSQRQTGLVLDRDLIPDRWIAPPRRKDLLPDGANPVLSKEIHSELIGQGTLMLRLIIQIGLALAVVPFTLLYFIGAPAWFFSYIAIFALLIAPTFTCGMFTGEHENRTFSLMATTLLRPRQIVMGKFLTGARLVLLLLGILIAPTLPALAYAHLSFIRGFTLGEFILCLVICLLWALALVALGLMWSLISRRTTTALVATYLTGGAILAGPLLIHAVVMSFPALPDAWAGVALPLSPLSHLFAIAPGEMSEVLFPAEGMTVSGGGGGLLFLSGALIATALALGAMTLGHDWVWRRWRGLGEA
ncbi:ABC transporter permease [Candidatus Sumerlaeota bacterium]|nr:ABC transporter permease [Candidatus Sumerlaeota bacterium]